MAALVAVGLLLPLGSKIEGTGSFAYTMFSGNTEYRLEIIATDPDGLRSEVAPALLAPRVNASARAYLTGADHFRRTRSIVALRAHLGDLAVVACEESAARTVRVTLLEKAAAETLGEDAPITRNVVDLTCK